MSHTTSGLPVSATGCVGHRPGKPAALPAVDHVEEGHGWPSSRAVTLAGGGDPIRPPVRINRTDGCHEPPPSLPVRLLHACGRGAGRPDSHAGRRIAQAGHHLTPDSGAGQARLRFRTSRRYPPGPCPPCSSRKTPRFHPSRRWKSSPNPTAARPTISWCRKGSRSGSRSNGQRARPEKLGNSRPSTRRFRQRDRDVRFGTAGAQSPSTPNSRADSRAACRCRPVGTAS